MFDSLYENDGVDQFGYHKASPARRGGIDGGDIVLPRSQGGNSSTGLVGIANQGATCYLNSLIQTLLFTPELRGNITNYYDYLCLKF